MNEFSITKLLADYQAAHSEFQIDNFIIGSQGNEWAQYKQCLREIHARVENIESLKDEIEAAEIELRGLKNSWCWRRVSRDLRRIKIRRVERRIKKNHSNLSESERELNRFVKIGIQIKEIIGEIDDQRRAKLERDMWFDKAQKMIDFDLAIFGKLNQKTIDFVFSLPDSLQEKINFYKFRNIHRERIMQ